MVSESNQDGLAQAGTAEIRFIAVEVVGLGILRGKATFLRAVAHAGLGNEHLASFDYVLAQRLVPASSRIDLSIYGEASALLEASRNPPPSTETDSKSDAEVEVDEADLSRITPPRKRSAPTPKFPFAKAKACHYGPIIVTAILDQDGSLKWPSLKTPQDPLLTFSPMDAFRTRGSLREIPRLADRCSSHDPAD